MSVLYYSEKCVTTKERFDSRTADLPAKASSVSSGLRVPAVAKRMVVSRSPMMPDTVLAAFSRAWVPVLAAFKADST